jgi:very-short-patch-repair endonuclease
MPLYRIPAEHRAFARSLRTAQTAQEAALWQELRNKRPDGWKFSRQVPIGPYVAHFLCPAARLIFEIDGPLHQEQAQAVKDEKRDLYLEGEGFSVLRFSADQSVASMLNKIREVLVRTPSPGLRASAKATLTPPGGRVNARHLPIRFRDRRS